MAKKDRPPTPEALEEERRRLHEASKRITQIDTQPISNRSWLAYRKRREIQPSEIPTLDPEIAETIRAAGTLAINALPERHKNALDAFLASYQDTYPDASDDIRYFRDLLDPDIGLGRIALSPEDVVRLLEIIEGESR